MAVVGNIVISKRGRDKSCPFVVVSIDGEYLYLADGQIRKLARPKKKKTMHVQITNSISSEVKGKILAGTLLDADLRKVLLSFKRNEEV